MTPVWTADMARLWNRAMLLAATERAYGVGLPQAGTTYPPPTPGSDTYFALFAATASDAEYDAYLEAVREDMTAWKARVKASKGRVLWTAKPDIDLSSLEIKL